LASFKDVQIASHHVGPIISLTSNSINAIALGDVMLKQSKWRVALLQRPAGIHLAITHSSCAAWESFCKAVRKGVQAMKIDPSLNVNHDTATYGLTGQIPDKSLLHEFACLHARALLDIVVDGSEKQKS
jgi:hypothetical protein